MPRSIEVTEPLLSGWHLPAGGASKYDRGQVIVIGGARRSPGAAILAGTAALRAGAGRLTLLVADSVAITVAVAVPESGVVALRETKHGHVEGRSIASAEGDLASADAVLVGPGLDDAAQTKRLLRELPGLVAADAVIVLDAFALGALATMRRTPRALRGRLVLTPNEEEAVRLLGHEIADDIDAASALADRYDAVVTYADIIAAPGRTPWLVRAGNSGLGTSGSGDVLSGAIAGLCARGASPAQATVWGKWAHSMAGDRLSQTTGPLGYLASEIAAVLPTMLAIPGS